MGSKNKSYGKTNKRKGSNAERYYAAEFRKLGFEKCITARFGSRMHDDAGIDLIFLPFNVQVKAGKQRGLNISKVLKDMGDRMKELFPEESVEHNLPKLLIHRKDVGQGRRRDQYHDIVSMTWEDFVKILKTNVS